MLILDWLKKQKSMRSFKKNATVGQNIQYSTSGRCLNGSRRKENIVIGDNSFVKGSICTQKDGKITIGDHGYIGANTLIGALDRISIGRCVIISNDVRIYDNNNHPTSPKAREQMSLNGFSNDNWQWHHSKSAPVVIEDNVWIGQYVTILKGVTIGKGSIVATRSVVTKDVPPYSIVAGNPAKVVKQIEVE